jgi:hypothetical protein
MRAFRGVDIEWVGSGSSSLREEPSRDRTEAETSSKEWDKFF